MKEIEKVSEMMDLQLKRLSERKIHQDKNGEKSDNKIYEIERRLTTLLELATDDLPSDHNFDAVIAPLEQASTLMQKSVKAIRFKRDEIDKIDRYIERIGYFPLDSFVLVDWNQDRYKATPIKRILELIYELLSRNIINDEESYGWAYIYDYDSVINLLHRAKSQMLVVAQTAPLSDAL